MGTSSRSLLKLGKTTRAVLRLQQTLLCTRGQNIDTKFHFIREKLEDKQIELKYTPTDVMAADLLTKSLPQVKVEKHQQVLLGEQILP